MINLFADMATPTFVKGRGILQIMVALHNFEFINDIDDFHMNSQMT